jgi:O-antigen/teichoic acid export membrane protein
MLNSKLLGRWLAKGFWAVSDQGLFALSNFALNVLLARWLVPQDYGAFTVAFTIFALLVALQTALLTEPMLVFGPGRYEDRLSEYLGALLFGQIGFAVLSGLLLVLTGLGFALSGSSAVSEGLVALAFAGPFILILWLMRRACYARFEPHLATLGGVLYTALMLMGAYALYRLEWLLAASALGVMGFSSLVVSLWLCLRLRVSWPGPRDRIVDETLEDHWRYGRWSVVTSALMWVPQVYILILPIWGGLEAAASLKAMGNFILPMVQANVALGALLLPTFTKARRQSAMFKSLVRFALVPFVLGPVLYWLFLGVLHRPLVIWLYGGQYIEDAYLLWLFGLFPVIQGATSVFAAALRASERPDQVFWAYLVAAGFSLTLGLAIVFAWGIIGAVVGTLGSSVVTAVAMWYLFATFFKRGKGGTEHA